MPDILKPVYGCPEFIVDGTLGAFTRQAAEARAHVEAALTDMIFTHYEEHGKWPKYAWCEQEWEGDTLTFTGVFGDDLPEGNGKYRVIFRVADFFEHRQVPGEH